MDLVNGMVDVLTNMYVSAKYTPYSITDGVLLIRFQRDEWFA